MTPGELTSVQELRAERQLLEQRADAYLLRRGWEFTNSTVGSFWLWSRSIAGRVYFVDRVHALAIQEHLDAELESGRG